MASSIQGISQLKSVMAPKVSLEQAGSASPGGVDFGGMLMNSLAQTNSLQNQAEAAIGQSITGEDITQVEVMSAVKKADLSMRMLMSVRNKLMDALNEVKQMQM